VQGKTFPFAGFPLRKLDARAATAFREVIGIFPGQREQVAYPQGAVHAHDEQKAVAQGAFLPPVGGHFFNVAFFPDRIGYRRHAKPPLSPKKIIDLKEKYC
jgi:hypothetical protein